MQATPAAPRLIHRSRLALMVLLMMLAGLQYRLWLGEGGVVVVQKEATLVQQQRTDNGQLRQRNAVLQAEVEDLRRGGQAIEARARTDLGMTRKGETFYLVVEPN
jgi:cell division protein FtsB